jgi:hypothetical protein
MHQESPKPNQSAAQSVWRVYFALAILQTCVAMALLFRMQSAEGAGLVLGISPVRLVFGLFLVVALLIFAWLLLETWLRPMLFEKHLGQLAAALGHRRFRNWLLVLCSGLFLVGLFSLLQLAEVEEPFTRAFFDRLAPLVIWVTGLSGQTVIALLVLRHGRGVFSMRPRGRLFYLVLLASGAILLGWSWVAKAVMPAESLRVGWNLQGTPIVEWQVLVAWLAGVLMLVLPAYLDRPSRRLGRVKRFALRRLDLLLALLIWLAAVLAWQGLPILPNWFVSEPAPPNYEYYPRSDAQAYDAMAQSALVGEGYRYYGLLYTRRPLLAMYLTFLRLLGGQSYAQVIFLQVLVFAWIPVLIYLLTKTLHTRMAGVIAATLIIFRESNSVWLTERITTSNVKLLMADLPGMLMTVLFVFVGVVWLEHIADRKLLALVCGGALGFAMLVRPETFVFLFPLLLISGLILWPSRQWRLWIQSSLFIGLGVLLVISPWIWRNGQVTGEIFFDNPLHNASFILQRFQPTSEPLVEPENLPAVPVESPAEPPALPSAELTPTPGSPNERLAQEANRALGSILQDPDGIARAVFAHYANSQIQTFLVLPTIFRAPAAVIAWLGHRSGERLWDECCGLVTYIREAPYWRSWDGRFPINTLLAIALNLLLLAYGVHAAWKQNSWTGVTPLVLAFTYLFANAFFRNSGGRYILPVDWVTPVYFSVGLAQATIVAWAYFGGAPQEKDLPAGIERKHWRAGSLLRSPYFYAALLGLFLLGSLVPAVEASFPQRYTAERSEDMLQALMESDQFTATQRRELQAFLAGGGAVFTGRALYPRYLPANSGDPGLNKKSPFSPRPYPRLGFYLAGEQNMALALPVDDKPSRFPNGQDVLVIGCDTSDLLLVARFSAEGVPDEVYLRSFVPAGLSCPLPVIPETDD